MDQDPQTLAPGLAQHAAAAAQQAHRLRQTAVALRRLAGAMKYHPVTRQRPEPPAALTGALEVLEQVLNEMHRGAAERAEDQAVLDARGVALAARIRAGHEVLEQQAQVMGVTLEVLRALLTAGDDAALDAPYGRSAPRRHHPGALCTIVAERAEDLARAIETLAVLKANVPADTQ
jgi:hypothetical protein